jgi:hypothetical protein
MAREKKKPRLHDSIRGRGVLSEFPARPSQCVHGWPRDSLVGSGAA